MFCEKKLVFLSKEIKSSTKKLEEKIIILEAKWTDNVFRKYKYPGSLLFGQEITITIKYVND